MTHYKMSDKQLYRRTVIGAGAAALTSIVTTTSTSAQSSNTPVQFEQIYNDTDFGFDVVETQDGYAALGTASYSNLIRHTDNRGDELWTQAYTPSSGDGSVLRELIQTSDGGYAAVGNVTSYEDGSQYNAVWFVKTDRDGTEQWQQTYPLNQQDYAFDVIQGSDGGYVTVGGTRMDGEDRMFALKTDQDGTEQWQQTYGSIRAHAVVKAADDDGYMLGGYGYSPNAVAATLLRIDEDGSQRWRRSYEEATRGKGLVQTSDGGYALGGDLDAADGNRHYWLAKIDTEGNEQWSQTYSNERADGLMDLVQTNDNGYGLAGSVGRLPGPDRLDGFVLKTDRKGDEQWRERKGISSENIDYIRGAAATRDNGIITVGETSRGEAGRDLWLYKFPPQGLND